MKRGHREETEIENERENLRVTEERDSNNEGTRETKREKDERE